MSNQNNPLDLLCYWGGIWLFISLTSVYRQAGPLLVLLLLGYFLISPVNKSLSDAICSAKSWAPNYCDVSSPGDWPHYDQLLCWRTAEISQWRLRALYRIYHFLLIQHKTILVQWDSSKWTHIILDVVKWDLPSYRHPDACFWGWASLLSSWLEVFCLL